jgi:transcription initiation factor TFIIB
MSEVEDIVKCSECNSRNLYFDEAIGEKFCKDCGLVLEDEMLEATSSGKEKGGDPNSARTHSAEREGFTLGSYVGERNIDGSIDKSKIGRILRKTNHRNHRTSHERNLAKGLVVCNMLAAEFGATKELRDQIIWNYRTTTKNRVMPGMSLEVRAAALVYYTFKDNGISRSLEEVCAKNSAHPRQVAKSARKIASFFRKPWILSQRNVPSEVEKYCSMLQGDRLFTSNAIKLTVLMFEIGEAKFVSTNDGFIAACIYLAGRLTVGGSFRTQADISRVCNITEVTLRNNLIAVLKLVNLTRDDVFDKMTPLMTLDDFIEGAYERAGKRE